MMHEIWWSLPLTLIVFFLARKLAARFKFPLLNPLLVAVFYRETVGPMSLLGCVIVVVSMVIYNVWKAREDTGVKSQES